MYMYDGLRACPQRDEPCPQREEPCPQREEPFYYYY